VFVVIDRLSGVCWWLDMKMEVLQTCILLTSGIVFSTGPAGCTGFIFTEPCRRPLELSHCHSCLVVHLKLLHCV